MTFETVGSLVPFASIEMHAPSGGPDKAEPAGTVTLDLALRILEFLARQERPVTLATVARTFSASKATVYRHLQTLVQHDFARRSTQKGSYQAGIKLLVLGEACRRSFDVVPVARDELTELGKLTGQAASIAAVVSGELVVLDMVQGHSVVEFGTRPGTRLDLHASALGKVWLAYGPATVSERRWSEPLKPWTPSTIISHATLKREVALTKKRGWALAPNETIMGINTVAAPIFNHRSELVASVGVTGSIQFVPPKPPKKLIDTVVSAANRISNKLTSGA